MRATLAASLILGAITASASPINTSLSCGVSTSRSCANIDTAKQPCETKQQYGATVTVCNVATYFAWPTIVSWEQCQATCAASKDCKSFEYTYYQPVGESAGEYGGATFCQLYNTTVASYTESCPSTLPSDKSVVKMSGQFYDVGCKQPFGLGTGVVRQKPDTDPVNGQCNSARLFNNNQQQWSRMGLTTAPMGESQASCKQACQDKRGCKSYYYGNNTEAYYTPAMSTDQKYWNQRASNGFDPALCLLLNQPVMSYTTAASSEGIYGNSFYDLNCPTS